MTSSIDKPSTITDRVGGIGLLEDPRPGVGVLAVIAVAVLLSFGRIVTHDFVTWDDESLIYRNADFLPPTAHTLAMQWAHPHEQMYIPLVYTAWWLLAKISWLDTPDPETGVRFNAILFHAMGLLLHIVSAWLVYRIIRFVCRRAWAESVWAAGAGALLFALHPAQVEAVAWATGLKDTLSGVLALAAIWQYLRHVMSSRGGERQWSWNYACGLAFFVLALLSKPSTVVVPIMLFCLDRAVTGRGRRSIALTLLPWAGAAIAAALVAAAVQPSGTSREIVHVQERPWVAADALAFYLAKTALPIHLDIDYGRRPTVILGNGVAYYSWLVPAAVAGLLVWARRRVLWLGAALFVISLIPVAGFIPFGFQKFSTVADRYLYLAMLGPALAAAWWLSVARGRWPAVVAVVVLVTLAVRSFVAAGVWESSESLYRNAIAVNPDEFLAHNDLATVLERRGDHDEAIVQWRTAITLRPDAHAAHADLIDSLRFRSARARASGNDAAADADDRELAGRIEQFLQLMPTFPQDVRASYDVHEYELMLGEVAIHFHQADEARRYLLRIPPSRKAHVELARLIEAAHLPAATAPSSAP